MSIIDEVWFDISIKNGEFEIPMNDSGFYWSFWDYFWNKMIMIGLTTEFLVSQKLQIWKCRILTII